jgi:ABC-2 type transport system ATP-binding protein
VSPQPLIAVRGVTKMFGQVRALDEISLGIGPGVTGLLGPNGSGKSTLLKLISGQLKPDTGEVELLGRDPFREPEVFKLLGLCPEQDRFYEDLSGHAFVEVLTRLHGFDRGEARDRAAAAMDRVGMTTDGRKRIGEMSRGMRQRTKIAQAIAHDPRVVLLDEPLTGADPVARADLIALVHALGEEGRCVVVSSHVLHEVEAMTHDVVLIRFGRLRAHGDIFNLRTLLTDRPYRIRVDVEDARRMAAQLLDRPHIRGVEIHSPSQLEVTTIDLDRATEELPVLAREMGMVIGRFTSPDADLESLYRYLVR